MAAVAGRAAFMLQRDVQLANAKLAEANRTIMAARQMDGNEGLTINDVTPDWIRTRGIEYPTDFGWTPNINFDWGPLLTLY